MQDDENFDQRGIGFTPPRDLGKAYSEIQEWHLTESRGEAIDPEFFTWDHWKAFSAVGLHSAWTDSVLWVLGYVLCGAAAYFIQENFPGNVLTAKPMQVLFWEVNGSPLYILVKVGSFTWMASHTGMCIRMSRLYTGIVCKKAIQAIFVSRTSFLFSFSIIVLVSLAGLHSLLTDQNIYRVGLFISNFSEPYAQRVYAFLRYFFKPYCFQASMIGLIASALSTILHFGAMMFYKFTKSKNKVLSPTSV